MIQAFPRFAPMLDAAVETPLRVAQAVPAVAARVAAIAGTEAVAHLSRTDDQVALPNEIWGEIASFSSRKDILNLRTTCLALKAEAETAVTTLSLLGNDDLLNFINTQGFRHVKLLRLLGIDGAGLQHLGRHLLAHPRHDLTIDIAEGAYHGLEQGLMSLQGVPLAGLQLSTSVNEPVCRSLMACAVPIALRGFFSRQELTAASRLTSLTKLATHSRYFDDDVATSFSSHTALQSLLLQASEEFTSAGVERIAQIETLRELSIQEGIYSAAPIDAAAAAALAANPCLELLRFHTSIQPFSEATLRALAASRSLKRIAISSGRGLHHLARIASLEHIKLSGRCDVPGVIDVTSARALAGMSTLRCFSVAAARFEGDGLFVMLRDCMAEALHLTDMPLDNVAVSGLLANVHVRELSLVNTGQTAEETAALSCHPTLTRLHIDYANVALRGRLTSHP